MRVPLVMRVLSGKGGGGLVVSWTEDEVIEYGDHTAATLWIALSNGRVSLLLGTPLFRFCATSPGTSAQLPLIAGRSLIKTKRKMGDHTRSHIRVVTDGGWAVAGGQLPAVKHLL